MGVYIGEPTVISDMQGPAPDGFHVPLSSEWQSIIDMLTTLGLITEDKSLSNTNLLTYLKASGSGALQKASGNTSNLNIDACTYWCCDKYTNKVGYSYYFSSDIYSQRVYYNAQSIAYAVRAFKDIPTIPDNTWTTLYNGSSIATGAGIFHNVSLGLISISSNGSMYITIQDKDIGASSVWNYGDTKDDNNCGKKFQRGNNYGFPRQNATSTSSTQVDASDYGPGNYYSSTTFITQSGRTSWDSSDNGNLWGGVTQGSTTKSVELKNAYIGEYQGRLPSAYQEVEWIGNSGTQYIDTGIAIPNHKAIANIEYTAFNDWMCLGAYMGPDSGVPGGHLRLYGGRAGTTGQFCYGLLSSYAEYGGSMSLNTKYELEVSMISGNLYFKHDGTTYGTSSATYTTSKAGNYGILAQNNEQARKIWNSAKVYDYKVYDSSDVLLRDFVPCYRIADSVIGMYELVNGVFYTNQGSGTFTKGADVN